MHILIVFSLVCQCSMIYIFILNKNCFSVSSSRETDCGRVTFPGDSTLYACDSVYFMASHLMQEQPVSHETPRPRCQLLLLGLLRIGGSRRRCNLAPLATYMEPPHQSSSLSDRTASITSKFFSVRLQPWSFPAFLFRSRTTPSCLTASSANPANLLPSIQPQTLATSAPAAACPPLPLWTPSVSPRPLSVPPEGETSHWMI